MNTYIVYSIDGKIEVMSVDDVEEFDIVQDLPKGASFRHFATGQSVAQVYESEELSHE